MLTVANAMLVCRTHAKTDKLQSYFEYVKDDEVKREIREVYMDEKPILYFRKITREQGYLEGYIYIAKENEVRKYVVDVKFVNDPPYSVKEYGQRVLDEDELYEYLKDASIELVEEVRS
ncbi:MAG: hypothetical protein QXW98_04225 [Candidatus Caldarchaeum sp.]